jgi:hypothetical protein
MDIDQCNSRNIDVSIVNNHIDNMDIDIDRITKECNDQNDQNIINHQIMDNIDNPLKIKGQLIIKWISYSQIKNLTNEVIAML